jgi:DNA-binding MarR family transcriptional regulator
VARGIDRDPILEAYRLWMENGWEDCAAGLTAVTSIMRVHQVLTQRADQILAPIELTFSRYEVLIHLYFSDGELRMAELGKRLQVHQTSVTNLIDKLEARDLVERIPHPADRRSTIVRITPAGRALTQQAVARLNSGLFRDLGLTSAEVHGLIALLTKMRRSWGDFENEPGWDLFVAGASLAAVD